MKVPLLDLKAQWATIREEALQAVAEVLDSQVCIGGPKLDELERNIAAISGCKFAVGVSSGTDALLCSLMALDIGPGDEVITTPFTFFATAGSIVRTGATPVFVDIDPRTYNINPVLLEPAVTKRTKAIMPVHLFGQMCDMDPIMEIAGKHRLHVIEDAAQAITAAYKGRQAGSIGTCGCFSFYPTKNLGGAGDGGMIVTNDEALRQRLVLLRNHGAEAKYFHKRIGGNFRLDAIQAALLLAKLPHLDAWSQARRLNAASYDERFAGSSVCPPYVPPDCHSIYNQYVVRVARRDQLMAHLQRREIGSEIYYPLPLHLQECFRSLGYDQHAFPQAASAAREVLALPCYPELSPGQVAYVAETVLEFVTDNPGK